MTISRNEFCSVIFRSKKTLLSPVKSVKHLYVRYYTEMRFNHYMEEIYFELLTILLIT